MKKLRIILLLLLASALILAALTYFGVIRLNTPPVSEFPVRGIDLSEYQGVVDWKVLATQEIDFAFIRATEGSGSIDEYFDENWRNSEETDLMTGAYHFFSFDSSAQAQAEHYIRAVGALSGRLPPVVDIEMYGAYRHDPPDGAAVRERLAELLSRLEARYGVKPILYATQASYNLYLRGEFLDHPIWIRDVYLRARLADGREWTFWQYSDKGLLDGYRGEEKHIDLDVFCGSLEELAGYLIE